MKKCGSCTKDLPDAALHCVFCGAKQPPAPATAQGMAKTVMGYGGQELEQLRQQAAAANAARPAAPPAPAADPYGAPRPAGISQPPPMQGGYPAPQAPASPANAKTMFAPSPVAQGAPGYPGPMGPGPSGMGPGPAPMGPSPMGPGPSPMGHPQGPSPMGQPQGMYQPPPHQVPSAQPVAPIAAATPPYLASKSAARAGRPIEPWKDSLRLVMFIWGALLLAAFVTPLSLDPLVFNWNMILDGEGTAKLPPLVVAAVGLLSIVLAAIPLTGGARGMLAMVLGVAGIFVPMLLSLADAEIGLQLILALVSMVGWVVLVASLLARHEYRDAALPRILVTIGALAALAPYVVPVGRDIPLVAMFQSVIDAPGAAKIVVILALVQVVLIVMSLLAWLPSPSSGMAKPLAWLLIIWGLVMHAAMLFLVGDPSMVEQTPYAGVMQWLVVGGPMSAGLGVAYLAIAGYGTASVIGKQLE